MLLISILLFTDPGSESSSTKRRCSHWPDLFACGSVLAPACRAALCPTSGPGCSEIIRSDLKVGFGPYTGTLLRTCAFPQINVLRRQNRTLTQNVSFYRDEHVLGSIWPPTSNIPKNMCFCFRRNAFYFISAGFSCGGAWLSKWPDRQLLQIH